MSSQLNTPSASPTSASAPLNFWLFPSGYPPLPTFTPPKTPSHIPCQRTRYETCQGGGWYDWSEGQRAGIIIAAVVVAIIVVLSCNCFSKSKYARKRAKNEPVTLEDMQNEQRGLERAVAEQQDIETSQAPPQTTMAREVPPTYQEAVKNGEPVSTPTSAPVPTQRATQTDGNPPDGWPPTYLQAASNSAIV
ncbi:hypothetical protein GMOD_00004357 [Pyrenophora seminiperda CCB06]|uniref:Uncharacterized protein n=1 Tax=Pyrenophora seminiperda CCB06 TaxID=1302712 RepID=A0A3M7M0X5_9PLEO|nr:hypothetical protein GMOD_00004357 [Pyrenophora seminiperda CCB06]